MVSFTIWAQLKTSSTEVLPPLIPMMVPRRPTGTEKFSLTFTTRSKRRNSASRSGMAPCCCSKGWTEESCVFSGTFETFHILMSGSSVCFIHSPERLQTYSQPQFSSTCCLWLVPWVLGLQACCHAKYTQLLERFPTHLLCTASGASLSLGLSCCSFFACTSRLLPQFFQQWLHPECVSHRKTETEYWQDVLSAK